MKVAERFSVLHARVTLLGMSAELAPSGGDR